MEGIVALFSMAVLATVFVCVIVLPLVLITGVLAIVWRVASFCLSLQKF